MVSLLYLPICKHPINRKHVTYTVQIGRTNQHKGSSPFLISLQNELQVTIPTAIEFSVTDPTMLLADGKATNQNEGTNT
jgi:hypothetical protein